MNEEHTKQEVGDTAGQASDQKLMPELISENTTIAALIKGVQTDIDILKKEKEGKVGIVRLTMQLNILKDKQKRNLAAINAIVKKHSSAGNA